MVPAYVNRLLVHVAFCNMQKWLNDRGAPYLCYAPLNVRQRRNHPERWLRTSPNPILSGQKHGR